MKKWLEYSDNLLRLGKSVGGVLTLMELSSVFDEGSKITLHSIINKFIEAGMLKRYCREIYTLADFDYAVLSAKVRQGSYVSLASALAAHRLIGTESQFWIFCIVQTKAAEYSGVPNISYYKLADEFYFGFKPDEKGVLVAEPEKAVIDTLYFYLRGKKFYFNVFGDINYSLLDKDKFFSYLTHYRNPKFKIFAEEFGSNAIIRGGGEGDCGGVLGKLRPYYWQKN
jgi:predicted transcriptional regulator of viral defense system